MGNYENTIRGLLIVAAFSVMTVLFLLPFGGCGSSVLQEEEVQGGVEGPVIENPNPPTGGSGSPSTPFTSVGSFSSRSENYSLKGVAFHYTAYHTSTETHILNADPLIHLGTKEVEP